MDTPSEYEMWERAFLATLTGEASQDHRIGETVANAAAVADVAVKVMLARFQSADKYRQIIREIDDDDGAF